MTLTPPQWITKQNDSLPNRMREAAHTLEEATRRYFPEGKDGQNTPVRPDHHDWRPVNLRYVADRFEEEDQEQAEHG